MFLLNLFMSPIQYYFFYLFTMVFYLLECHFVYKVFHYFYWSKLQILLRHLILNRCYTNYEIVGNNKYLGKITYYFLSTFMLDDVIVFRVGNKTCHFSKRLKNIYRNSNIYNLIITFNVKLKAADLEVTDIFCEFSTK